MVNNSDDMNVEKIQSLTSALRTVLVADGVIHSHAHPTAAELLVAAATYAISKVSDIPVISAQDAPN